MSNGDRQHGNRTPHGSRTPHGDRTPQGATPTHGDYDPSRFQPSPMDESNESSLTRQRNRRQFNNYIDSLNDFHSQELENINKALGTSISSSFNRKLRERRDQIEQEIEKKTEDARKILEKEQEKTLTEEEKQERERREGNQGIDSTKNGGKEQDETGANTDKTGEKSSGGGLPEGYVETAVTLCQNGSPVTGSILFKPDTP